MKIDLTKKGILVDGVSLKSMPKTAKQYVWSRILDYVKKDCDKIESNLEEFVYSVGAFSTRVEL